MTTESDTRKRPVWTLGTAVGLRGIAFRRGIRLERDVRGLV